MVAQVGHFYSDEVGQYYSGANTDLIYVRDDVDTRDFEYAARQAVQLAEQIAHDQVLVERAVATFVTSPDKTPFPFARRLAELSADPVSLVEAAVTKAESQSGDANIRFFGGLIAGAENQNADTARECIRRALRSDKLRPHAASLISSGKLQPRDITLVVGLLETGDIQPWQAGALAYGKGTDHLSWSEVTPLLNELMRHGSEGIWALLDSISMRLYGGNLPDAELVEILRSALTASDLLSKPVRSMDGHHLESVIKALLKHDLVNDRLAEQIAQQLLATCQETTSEDVFRSLDDAVKAVLRLLIKAEPAAVWKALKPYLVMKSWRVEHRLDDLMEPASHGEQIGPGLIHDFPADVYLSWVREDPTRAAVIAKWLPVAIKEQTGELKWHPDLVTYIGEFAEQEDVLGTIGTRLYPRSWWGSLANHLPPYVQLLTTWVDHPNAKMRAWARSGVQRLEREIRAARKRDEDDEVRLF